MFLIRNQPWQFYVQEHVFKYETWLDDLFLNRYQLIASPSQFQKGSKEDFMKKENKKIKEENNKKEDNNSYWIAIGMCIGISVGTSIGASTNNMGLWLPIGLSIGLCIGLALSSGKNKNGKKQELENMFC